MIQALLAWFRFFSYTPFRIHQSEGRGGGEGRERKRRGGEERREMGRVRKGRGGNGLLTGSLFSSGSSLAKAVFGFLLFQPANPRLLSTNTPTRHCC